MVEDGDFLLEKLLHRVVKADSSTEVLVVKVGYLVEDRCSSTLGDLAQELGRYLVACCSQEDLLEIVLDAEVGNEPFFEEETNVCRK